MEKMEPGYRPTMSGDEIRRRREWWDRVRQDLLETKEERTVEVLGRELVVLPEVFPPVWPDSVLLAKAVQEEVKEDDYVLDLGTGSGVQGIVAADKGAWVVATDINPQALVCTRRNAEKCDLTEKVKVIRSDLFSKIKQEKFDLIIFNPPFRWFESETMPERAGLDENYKTLRQFFEEARDHLKREGRILTVFSTTGDMPYFESLIEKNNYQSEVVTETESDEGWQYKVYKLRA